MGRFGCPAVPANREWFEFLSGPEATRPESDKTRESRIWKRTLSGERASRSDWNETEPRSLVMRAQAVI